MTAVVTLRVQRRDLDSLDEEVRGQLQAALDTAVSHLRARYYRHPVPTIESALNEELCRATGGRVVEHDLPLAATAIRRGDYLTASLLAGP